MICNVNELNFVLNTVLSLTVGLQFIIFI